MDIDKLISDENLAIEGKLILLKRKAAEAGTLRAERDQLLQKLSQLAESSAEEVKIENEKLLRANFELQDEVEKLKNEVIKTQFLCLEREGINSNALIHENMVLKKELSSIKQSMKEDSILKSTIAERDQLLLEKKKIMQDIDLGFFLPGKKEGNVTVDHLKQHLTKQCYRLKQTLESNVLLQNALNERDVRLDLLYGKVTQLQSQLGNYEQSGTKKESSSDEQLASTLANLNRANQLIKEELSDLSFKFNLLYKQFQCLEQENAKLINENMFLKSVQHGASGKLNCPSAYSGLAFKEESALRLACEKVKEALALEELQHDHGSTAPQSVCSSFTEEMLTFLEPTKTIEELEIVTKGLVISCDALAALKEKISREDEIDLRIIPHGDERHLAFLQRRRQTLKGAKKKLESKDTNFNIKYGKLTSGEEKKVRLKQEMKKRKKAGDNQSLKDDLTLPPPLPPKGENAKNIAEGDAGLSNILVIPGAI